MRKLFGTDGVRGIFGKDLTLDLAYQLGKASAYILKADKKITAVIGRDTRASGEDLAKNLIKGLREEGVNVLDLGIIPTPAVSFAIKKYKADMGVMISASHNPAEYNGIKFFNSDGEKLADEIEAQIEKYINFDSKASNSLGTYTLKSEAVKDYVDFLSSNYEATAGNLKIVVDCAYGSSSVTAPKLFANLGFDAIIINNLYDGTNINLNCGSTHLDGLIENVKNMHADLGIAYDGDADRCLMVASDGRVIDGDFILAIMAKNMKEKGILKNNTLVGTVMSNLGLKMFCKKHDINFVSTNVGDRYVLEKMVQENYNLGGEQSGHIIFRDIFSTGDGELTSLMLLNVIGSENKSLLELSCIMKSYPQVLINVNVTKEGKINYLNDQDVLAKINEYESILKDEGRILVRASGTENLVRVMIEGENEKIIYKYAQDIAGLIKEKFGS